MVRASGEVNMPRSIIGSTVHVQNGWRSDDPEGETRWLSSLIETENLATVFVGYANLSALDIDRVLTDHIAFPAFRGIRQILNWHENPHLRVASAPDMMEQPEWRRGFSSLAGHHLSFDLQIYWPQMEMALELAQDFPQTQIVLNHFGMPIDRSASALRHWSTAMERLASADNVSVKLSGYGLGHPNWLKADTIPILQDTIRTFGPDRVVFGSSLPVDLLFSRAERLVDTFEAAILFLAPADREKLRHANAERIYRR